MPMTQRDFELVASSIRCLRSRVQADLNPCYAENGAIVLDQLTEQLAEDCAARYPRFEREAFLRASRIHEIFDGPAECASGTRCVDPTLVYRIGSNMPAGRTKDDTRSFDAFEEAKSAMMRELDHHAGFYAQLESESRVRDMEEIQTHLQNATGPEWRHADGYCEFWIIPSEA